MVVAIKPKNRITAAAGGPLAAISISNKVINAGTSIRANGDPMAASLSLRPFERSFSVSSYIKKSQLSLPQPRGNASTSQYRQLSAIRANVLPFTSDYESTSAALSGDPGACRPCVFSAGTANTKG